ncbi:penicillin-binding transpeptidase domain-containing protein [Actinoplanes sp. NPDC051494]|uniref:penicillin-binding transpeptidase domain-containing protein n=1 Tax=Actinoplanes sp. NPDC051494 TaxID=3363907 RepID=UPI003796E1C7
MPRSDGTPRRGQDPRRGSSSQDQTPEDEERGFGGIGEARAYTPRGRTVRESSDQRSRSPRAGRTGDPFRPSLQVLDGGRPSRDRRHEEADRRREGERELPPQRRARADKGDKSDKGKGTTARRRTAEEKERRTRTEPTRATAGTGRTRSTANPRRGTTASTRRDGAAGTGRDGSASTRRDGTAGTRRGSAAGARESSVRGSRARETSARESGARDGGARDGGVRVGRARDGGDRAGRGGLRDGGGRSGARDGGGRGGAGERARTGSGGRLRAESRPGSRTDGFRVVPAEPPKLASSSKRLRLGTVLALTLFATIGVRLVVLQVMDSPASAQSLLEQRQKRLIEVVLPAPRGSITDRNGAVLAHSVAARHIYADPEMVTDPVGASAQLAPLLGVPQSKLMQLMAKKKRPGGGESRFEYLARGVDIAVADKIKKLDLDGIGWGRDERRDVPGADLAANLIGFTGEDHTGLEGIEARYNDVLRGVDGKKVYETGNGDLAKEIPGGYKRETAAAPGSSVQLTIDSFLQFDVQQYLQQYMEEVSATVGGAVVMDARTGEVLAQASYPTYNAQKPLDFKPAERDDAVSSVITDPGSTHKAFTIGAALQEGVITKDSEITVGKALELGGTTFPDTHPFPAGTKLTIPQVLAYSSNVGTIRIGQKLGKEKLYEYQQKFGLGRSTDEGMPAEASGALLAPADWSGSSYGSVPIGHSVDATLLQMVAGYAAIANDGTYIQPHLIKSTTSGNTGKVTAAAPPETHRVLSPEVASELREMMEAVVDAKGATGGKAKVEGYRISGKTGTGNLLINGRYTKHNASSFIGMAPAENPRFVVGVFADVATGTGGDVAAPAFSKMMSAALVQYRVPPSGTPAPRFDWKE